MKIEELTNYCLNCKNKPCVKGCPLKNNIPDIINFVKYDEEGRVLADLSKTRNTLLNNELEYNEKGNGIKENNYNLERDDMQKYKNDGYINLEIGEMDKLLLGSYMLKSETDENLLKYVNMSIKMGY